MKIPKLKKLMIYAGIILLVAALLGRFYVKMKVKNYYSCVNTR